MHYCAAFVAQVALLAAKLSLASPSTWGHAHVVQRYRHAQRMGSRPDLVMSLGTHVESCPVCLSWDRELQQADGRIRRSMAARQRKAPRRA